jgi:hypothetical protein
MQKEIPILYSTPMVQSLMKDLKTITRRTRGLEQFNIKPNAWKFTHRGDDLWSAKPINHSSYWEVEFKCPYGKKGDLLWVRETFCHDEEFYYYKANFDTSDQCHLTGSWKPSIHMPKKACRTWLKITDIKIQRLKDISEEDAKAEGVEYGTDILGDHGYKCYLLNLFVFSKATTSFQTLWESINGSDSWNLNPWVWVITFKRVEKP